MFLKKTALLGTLILFSLPFSARADLITNNYHPRDASTVKLTSGSGICSGTLGAAGITRPGEMKHRVSQSVVDNLCKGSPGGLCTADIYMTSNCTGPVVAHAVVNINAGPQKGEVVIQDLGDPNYIVVKNGFSEISMGKR